MKETLTINEVAHRLYADKNAGWSWDGAKALAEYMEQYEEDLGEELELDVVAIRCDYSEYDSALEAAQEYRFEPESEEEEYLEEEALEWLEANTTVIRVKGGGVIIQAW